MSRFTVLLVVAVAVVCFALASVHMSSRSPRADMAADHASHRTNEWGVKALRELLGRAGLKTASLRAPFTELDRQRGVLWVLDPQADITEAETRALLSWAAAGNRVIFAPDPSKRMRGMTRPNSGPDLALLSRLGWSAEQSGEPIPERVDPVRGAPFCADVAQLHLPRSWRLKDGSGGQPGAPRRLQDAPSLWRVVGRPGEPVLAAGKVGEGELVILCDADLLSNYAVGQADNIVLAANLSFGAPGDTVYFDESHRRRDSADADLRLDRAAPNRALWALLLIFATFFAGRALRFGAPVPAPAPPGRSAVEYVRALATVYQRARRPRAALQLALSRFQGLLCSVAAVSPGLEPDALARAVVRRRPETDPAALESLLRECDAASQPAAHLDDADLLRLVRRISRFEQELDPHDL